MIRTFTGLYDSTTWEKLSFEEKELWLLNHIKNDWIGKPIYSDDKLNENGKRIRRYGIKTIE